MSGAQRGEQAADLQRTDVQPGDRVGPAVAGVTCVEIDGCVTLYSPASREVVALNATASDVWRLSDGSRTLDELVDEVAAAYDCTPPEVAGAVAQIVAGLRAVRCLGP